MSGISRHWRALAAVAAAALAVGVAVAVLLWARSDDGPSPATPAGTATAAPPTAIATPGPPRVVSCPPPVDQAGCDFAAQAEAWVRTGDVAALVGRGSNWDNANDRARLTETLDNFAARGTGQPLRLVSIACPTAVPGLPAGPQCAKAIGLAFTTLPDDQLPSATGTMAVLILGFDRQDPRGPQLTGVGGADGDNRGFALTGGTAVGCTNFSGIRVKDEQGCAPSAFYPVRVDHGSSPTATATATPGAAAPQLAVCPPEAGKALCDFAAAAEAKVKAGGLAALAPGTQFPPFDPPGTPYLSAIGCPNGSVPSQLQSHPGRPDCGRAFALAFATIAERDLSAKAGGVAVLRFGITAARGMTYESRTWPIETDQHRAISGGDSLACEAGPAGSDDCFHFWPVETLAPGARPYDPTAPEVINGLQVTPLRLGPDAQLPPGVVLYYEVGPYASETGPENLWRAYRDSAGQLHNERLWSFDDNFTGAKAQVNTWAAAWNMGEIVAAVCIKPGTCLATGLGGGPAPGSARLRVFRSKDGGVSWKDDGGEVPVGTTFVTVTHEGVIARSVEGNSVRTWLYPSGQTIPPPEPGYFARYTPGVGLTWGANEPVPGPTYDANGSLLYRSQFALGGPRGSREQVLARDENIDYWVSWLYIPQRPSDPRPGMGYIAKVAIGGQPKQIWSSRDMPNWLQPWPIAPGLFAWGVEAGPGTAERLFAFEAAIYDFTTGLISPLRELSAGLTGNRNPFVRAATVGPVLRVRGAGDCLNVRAEPGIGARILGCYRDNVLLGDVQEEHTAGGITWKRVTTPAGESGWASAQYLD